MNDDAQRLLAEVARLTWPDTTDLTCPEPGHAAGHTCLARPGRTDADADAVARELSARYGGPGPVTAAALAALPRLDGTAWRHVWTFSSRWIASGRAADGRPALVVARRTVPSVSDLPPGASWLERLTAVTGWDRTPALSIDWAEHEARLGTPLPGDFKATVDAFGTGLFDGFLELNDPERIRQDAAAHARSGPAPWRPHPAYPAPGGLLPWSANEHEQTFYWLTGDPDPDRWPVYATEVGPHEGQLFDCTATEFLYRQLTEPGHPYGPAAAFAAHWFLPAG
ncbi:hypothetical protein [Streptomyces sp. enrichment culture]|uniref:hypothetical protein n=1 Tax=Streptomyces sp. enrichment culture TaxID=1795815 RepID=UPI003F56D497